MFQRLGAAVLAFLKEAGSYSRLVGQCFAWTFRRPFEFQETIKQLERVGVQSFPVVGFTALFTGMVLSLQIYEGFRRFQAEDYVPVLLGLALLRELVPVLGGMMVAGRVGSAMAAEVGTMKVSEQISALEVMATNPVQFLVVPRVLAGTLMLPLLIGLGDLIGILGGWYLITGILGSSAPAFMDRTFEFLDPEDFWSGILKAAVFGMIITTVGCYKGLMTRGGAEGVGRSTTSAVVTASLGILVADFFLTKVLF